ncbi:hypothetical protein MRX96_002222 [Rhipicephalus microplus]
MEDLFVQPTFFSAVIPRRLVDSVRDFDSTWYLVLVRGVEPALDFERDLMSAKMPQSKGLVQTLSRQWSEESNAAETVGQDEAMHRRAAT